MRNWQRQRIAGGWTHRRRAGLGKTGQGGCICPGNNIEWTEVVDGDSTMEARQ
jgi:hypothetical protein